MSMKGPEKPTKGMENPGKDLSELFGEDAGTKKDSGEHEILGDLSGIVDDPEDAEMTEEDLDGVVAGKTPIQNQERPQPKDLDFGIDSDAEVKKAIETTGVPLVQKDVSETGKFIGDLPESQPDLSETYGNPKESGSETVEISQEAIKAKLAESGNETRDFSQEAIDAAAERQKSESPETYKEKLGALVAKFGGKKRQRKKKKPPVPTETQQFDVVASGDKALGDFKTKEFDIKDIEAKRKELEARNEDERVTAIQNERNRLIDKGAFEEPVDGQVRRISRDAVAEAEAEGIRSNIGDMFDNPPSVESHKEAVASYNRDLEKQHTTFDRGSESQQPKKAYEKPGLRVHSEAEANAPYQEKLMRREDLTDMVGNFEFDTGSTLSEDEKDRLESAFQREPGSEHFVFKRIVLKHLREARNNLANMERKNFGTAEERAVVAKQYESIRAAYIGQSVAAELREKKRQARARGEVERVNEPRADLFTRAFDWLDKRPVSQKISNRNIISWSLFGAGTVLGGTPMVAAAGFRRALGATMAARGVYKLRERHLAAKSDRKTSIEIEKEDIEKTNRLVALKLENPDTLSDSEVAIYIAAYEAMASMGHVDILEGGPESNYVQLQKIYKNRIDDVNYSRDVEVGMFTLAQEDRMDRIADDKEIERERKENKKKALLAGAAAGAGVLVLGEILGSFFSGGTDSAKEFVEVSQAVAGEPEPGIPGLDDVVVPQPEPEVISTIDFEDPDSVVFESGADTVETTTKPNEITSMDFENPSDVVFESSGAVTVVEGDSVSGMLQQYLANSGVGAAEQSATYTKVIGGIYDLSPEQLKEIGISSGNPDLIYPGETIDLQKLTMLEGGAVESTVEHVEQPITEVNPLVETVEPATELNPLVEAEEKLHAAYESVESVSPEVEVAEMSQTSPSVIDANSRVWRESLRGIPAKKFLNGNYDGAGPYANALRNLLEERINATGLEPRGWLFGRETVEEFLQRTQPTQ